jgi:uncharacterized protein YgiM (DUF1202 family)
MSIETDRIKIAKDLIKKAKELNDDELLAMAHSILYESSADSGSASNNTDVKPKRQKRKSPAKKPAKPKKAATKRKLDIKKEEDTDSSFISNVFQGGRTQARQTKTDEDGREKIACRTEKIQVKTQPIDTGEEKNDRPKKYKKNPTGFVKSKRKNVSPFITITCEECGKQKEIPRALARENYVCDRCIMKKGTR